MQRQMLMSAACVVDVCPAHGTWFDREEIAAVTAACGALRRELVTEEALPTSPRDGAPHLTAWGVFASIVETLGGIIARGL
jgi:hypothetical protein